MIHGSYSLGSAETATVVEPAMILGVSDLVYKGYSNFKAAGLCNAKQKQSLVWNADVEGRDGLKF